ncbi:MAG: hypothetical protein ACI4QB_02345 [Eubacteriales bacterium]
MNGAAPKNRTAGMKKLFWLCLAAAAAVAFYMTVNVRFDNPKLASYALHLRSVKVIVMLLAAAYIFCICC